MGRVGKEQFALGQELLYAIADAMERDDTVEAKNLNREMTKTGLYLKNKSIGKIQSALLSYRPESMK